MQAYNAQGELISHPNAQRESDAPPLTKQFPPPVPPSPPLSPPSLNSQPHFCLNTPYAPDPFAQAHGHALRYPPLYTSDAIHAQQQDSFAHAHAHALRYPSLYSSDAFHAQQEMSKEEKKREKREAKQRKQMEKLEAKRQRVENGMIERLPTHMYILALPLVAGQDLLFLTTNYIPPGRARAKIEDKWTKAFAALHPGAADTLKGKALRWTNRQFEGLSPETRLLGNMPKSIHQITLVHPGAVSEPQIFDDLVNLALTSKQKHKKRLILYSIAFPFIAAAEALTPVWPNIITVVDAAFILFHMRAYRGSKRLARFVAAYRDRVDFAMNPAIDKWSAIVSVSEYGVLEEQQITEMCNEIGVPELIETLCELRRRYLRQTNQLALLPPKQR